MVYLSSDEALELTPDQKTAIKKPLTLLHFIGAQKADGGWTYSQGNMSTGSMTAAGLTALYVGRQELFKDGKAFHPKFDEALKKGVAWLDRNFKGVTNTNANEWTYYYLYGIERVALRSLQQTQARIVRLPA